MRRKDTMHNWYQLTHFAGFDWTKDHHDVAILDRQGQVVNRFTFAHSGEGWAQWREKIQAYQAPAGAIETSHGAAVEQLLAYSSELSKTYAILSPPTASWRTSSVTASTLAQWKSAPISAPSSTARRCTCNPDTLCRGRSSSSGRRATIPPRRDRRTVPIPQSRDRRRDSRACGTTIEGEFFDAQVFGSRADFFAKITTYQLWYNVARKNPDTRCRGWKSPVELLAGKAPQALPQNLLASPPAVGVTSYPQGGSRCTGASRIVARKHGIGRSKRAPSRPPIASAWQRWRPALRSR